MNNGIVDTHLHLWDLEKVSIPWLAPDAPRPPGFDTSSFAKDYLPEDYLRETGRRVVGAVYEPVASADWLAEARWVQEQSERTGVPDVFLAMGDPAADGFEQYLDTIGQTNRLRGIALAPGAPLDNPALLRGFRLMAARNLNFECVCMVQTLPAFAKVAAAFPQMQLVLPHLGNPRAEVLHPWRREMRNLAQFQNVSVKITGWGAVNRAYDLDAFRPFVEDTLSIFGVDRCIYGTNMPVDKQFRSFESQIDKFEELLGGMKADERDRLFRTNAQRIYRFQQSRRYVP